MYLHAETGRDINILMNNEIYYYETKHKKCTIIRNCRE